MSCWNVHQNNHLDDDVDKENITPVNNVKSMQPTINHALTQPRMINGNHQIINDEEKQHTPCFIPISEVKSKSAPGPKALKNVTNVIGGSRLPFEGEIETILKDIVAENSPIVQKRRPEKYPVSMKAKILKADEKKYKASATTIDSLDCQMIVDKLNLAIDKADLDQLNTPLMLFRYLEEKGLLSSQVLSYFAGFSLIDSLNMSPSYSNCLNEFGLVVNGRFPCKKCTVPIFNGFDKLVVLDLTNVMIGDDELRYLIKLRSLKALGLAGTNITNKGLKYLGKHAEFTKSLQCIKLCYNLSINDLGLSLLAGFRMLAEIDLWGCEKITMSGCLGLVKSNVNLSKVRLPAAVAERINELHHIYSGLTRMHHDIILKAADCLTLDEESLKRQLKYHRNQFTDIFFNVPKDDLLKRLCQILTERSQQESLFCLKM